MGCAGGAGGAADGDRIVGAVMGCAGGAGGAADGDRIVGAVMGCAGGTDSAADGGDNERFAVSIGSDSFLLGDRGERAEYSEMQFRIIERRVPFVIIRGYAECLHDGRHARRAEHHERQ